MLDWLFSEGFLTNAIAYAIPILYAAFAALISNKAGMVAINIEGAMSAAAVTGALVSHFTGSWALGLMGAVLAGMGMMLLLSLAAQTLRADSFLSGIALNTLSGGLCVLALTAVLGVKGDSSAAPSAMIPAPALPLLSRIPVVGKALFSQSLLFYLLIAAFIALRFLLEDTRLGVRVKTAGYHPEAGESVGVSAKRTRLIALLLCGALAGLGGAYLSMANLGYFSSGMVAGRGFIGIAAEAMGAGVLWQTAAFAFLFGAVDYFAVGAQTVLSLPYELLNTLPYLMTLSALVIYSLARRGKGAR